MRDWLGDALARLEKLELGIEEVEKLDREEFGESEHDFAGKYTKPSEVLTKLIDDQECEALWRALERRHHANTNEPMQIAHHSDSEPSGIIQGKNKFLGGNIGDHCLRNHLLSVEIISGKAVTSSRDQSLVDTAYYFAIFVAELLDEVTPTTTMSSKRATLDKVEKAVENLKSALAPIWKKNTYCVRGYSSTDIQSLINESIYHWSFSVKQMRIPVEGDLENIAAATSACEYLLNRPYQYLDALKEDSKKWASESVEISKPNDANAKRLFFIRRLTAYFRECYGEALRKPVLVTSSVFFDCSSLDESAIAKLAP